MIQLFRPHVSDEAIAAVEQVLRSGWIGIGPKTAEFESRFQEYVGAKHAVALNSATAALHLAMIVSGVQPLDEVLTVSLTFVSTNHAIRYVGAEPVFVDVDRDTLNIDLDKAERMVSAKTKAIVVVHYGGNPCDLDRVYAFAQRHGLKVIEDAAHACGASFKGAKIGSSSEGLTCFSFHAVKNLPMGDGGMVTTNDDDIHRKLLKLRWMGIDRTTFERFGGGYQWEYEVSEIGFKNHMNDISAAIGVEHLKKLDDWNQRRRDIIKIYKEGLSGLVSAGQLRFVQETNGAISASHLCVVRVPNRNQVADGLKQRGISIGVHYTPNHHYSVYKDARKGDLQETERAYTEIMSLPLHLYLTDTDAKTVCSAIKEVVESGPQLTDF